MPLKLSVKFILLGNAIFKKLNAWFANLVSYLQIKFPIHKWEWNHCPKGRKKNKASYPHLGSISSLSILIPSTMFSSRFGKNRATEFFRRQQKFGELSLSNWQAHFSISHLNYLGRLEASPFPEAIVPSQQEDYKHSESSSQTVAFRFSWKLLIKGGLSEALIFTSSHN